MTLRTLLARRAAVALLAATTAATSLTLGAVGSGATAGAAVPGARPSTGIATTSPASGQPRRACTDRAATEILRTSTAPVITLAATETYPGPSRVTGYSSSDPGLSRTLRARVLRAPASVLAPAELFASVMAAYRADGGTGRFRARVGRTTDAQESVSVPGTTRVRRAGTVVWYRGYRTLRGTFRYTACVDGADVQRTGRFTTYGAGRSDAQPCRDDAADPVARLARRTFCA